MGNTEGPELELLSTTRRFGEVLAVDNLSLTLKPGQVHALIGENGAGKSTALKMLAGHLPPSAGEVRVNGQPLLPATPQEAIARSIGMVHQHFMLVEAFDAIENLVLGSEPVARFGRLDLAAARERARTVGQQCGLQLDLERPTRMLSVGERQRLEILRVLYRGARALLLDEPTAVLSPVEVSELYRTLRRLADDGATIAVVTHRLDEVVRFCDTVTVMRHGAGVLDEPLPDREGKAERAHDRALNQRLTRAVMGGEPPAAAEPPTLPKDRKAMLGLHNIDMVRDDGIKALDDISLSIQSGEIVGVAGVEGNGQSELSRVLAGLEPLAAGHVDVDDKLLFEASDRKSRTIQERSSFVRRARQQGLMVVHEDRHRDEMLLEATVADNLVLGDLGTIDEEAKIESRFARFKVHPPNHQHEGGALSGGNQQKVVMARALDRNIRALVLAQPTRGVDVGTARTIHHAIAASATDGAAVLILSADLNELRSLCHRIIVLRRGRIVAEFPPSASDEDIGHAMLGTEAA